MVVTSKFDASNDNDPSSANVDVQIDLALLLSEHYGRNIRQGNSFKVNGVQAFLFPTDDDTGEFVDAGVSAAVKMQYIPAVGHSRRAWNNIFKQWKAQKNLKGAVGTQIRYDDMEFCWETSKATSRTSTIMAQGIGDSNDENLCLIGSSSSGTDVSLRDYYNSSYPTPGGSIDQFGSSVIKEPKFGATPFPEDQEIHFAASNSARTGLLGDSAILGSGEGLTSALAFSEMNMLPTPINVLCGLFRAQAYIMPDDTADQIEEDFGLKIAISVVSWKPLVYRPRRKTGRKSSKKSGGGRSGTRSTSKNARS